MTKPNFCDIIYIVYRFAALSNFCNTKIINYVTERDNIMRKQIISIFLCFAMLLSIAPIAVSADGASEGGAKFGIKNGDILSYAGADGTPVKWRVIDAEKTNTDNTGGMLLLSENTLADPTSIGETSTSWLSNDCNNFYNTYFGDLYKDAVMQVNKTDKSYKIGLDSYKGELPQGTTVFALSVEEFSSLSDDLKKFTDSSDWWLRSVCIGATTHPLFSYYTYAKAETGDVETYLIGGGTDSVKLRPAVNLNKDKFTEMNGKILLLPEGEFSAANNRLAPVNTAQEWKLSLKNDTTVTAHTSYNTSDSLELNIETDQSAVDANDYISVIIVKNDGNISHYGRYKQTAAKQDIRVTIPSDVNAETDSMYVFAEDYNGALSGSASEPVKVCISHKFDYTSLGDGAHRAKCGVCGYDVTQSHNFTYSSVNAATHQASCICGYSAAESHTYIDKIDDTLKDFACDKCKASNFSAIYGDPQSTTAVLRDEYKDGSAKLNGEVSDAADSIFKNDDSSAAVAANSTKSASLTFDTNHKMKAVGFQIGLSNETAANLPETITLFGMGEDGNCTEIGTAAVCRLIDSSTADGKYSFIFTDKDELNTYNSFKAEMKFGTANKSFDLTYFGLLSESSIATVTINLTGALATDAPSAIYPDEDYTASFISGDGHPLQRHITILEKEKENRKLFGTDNWEYSPETGILRIPNQNIKQGSKYEIDIFCSDTVTIMFDSQTLSLVNSEREVWFGQEYIAEFRVLSGKQELAPKSLSDITVTNKNGDVTHLCSLDSSGKLRIPGELLIGGSSDNIYIYAEEAGRRLPQENAAVKVTKSGDVDRYFSNIDDAKAVIESDGDTDITLFKNADSTETITLKNKKVNINLGGNTLAAKSGNAIFNVESGAEVNISNGALSSGDSQNIVYACDGGVLTLNNVTTSEYEQSVYIDTYMNDTYVNPAKLILDGANSNVSVYLRGGFYEQKDGTSRITSAPDVIKNIKLYGGNAESLNVGKADLFTLTDDGYAFKFFDLDGDKISDSDEFKHLIEICHIRYPFAVKKSDIITEQPRDITVEVGESARLNIGVPNGAQYYWFDPSVDPINSERECKSADNYMEIGTDTPVGEYTYSCAVLTNDNVVCKSRTAKVTVVCHHKSVTDGICDVCHTQLPIQVTADDKTEYFNSIFDAAAFANDNENTTIKLFDDVEIDDYVKFSGTNTTLDMNGKTFSSSNINRFINVIENCSLTVSGNGNMTARIIAEGESIVTIENGTFGEVSLGCNTVTVNGGTFTTLNITKGNAAINGGTFDKVNVSCNKITINDGTFKKLNIYQGKTALSGGTFNEIYSVEDFYTLLSPGKAFIGINDGEFNTQKYEYYNFEEKIIANVTIADAPFVITEQPTNKFVADDSVNESISVRINAREGYEDITYQWKMYSRDSSSAENENYGTTASVKLPTGLNGGVQKTFLCIVSYGDYAIRSEYATVTFGKGTPMVDYENYFVSGNGNDCTFILSLYSDGRLIRSVYQDIKKEDENYNLDEMLYALSEDIDLESYEIKEFFWDGFGSIKPLKYKKNGSPLDY